MPYLHLRRIVAVSGLTFALITTTGIHAQQNANEPTYQPVGPSIPVAPAVEMGIVEVTVIKGGQGIDYAFRNVVGSFYETKNGQSYIAIRKRSRITFRLANSDAWGFDAKAGPFRLTKADSARFYHASYSGSNGSPNEFVLEVTPTGVLPANAGPNEIHPFVLQVVERNSGKAIEIDPDVKNPPPPPG